MIMNRWFGGGLLGALLLAGLPALAFEEVTSGSTATPRPATAIAPSPAAPITDSLDLAAPDSGSADAGGTEINIPGLGSIGVLPKLDFGLELLYGATSDGPGAPEIDVPADGDLTVKGEIKHTF